MKHSEHLAERQALCRRPRGRFRPVWLLVTLPLLAATPAAAAERMTFIGIEQGRETRQADDELRGYLEQRSLRRGGGKFDFETPSYGEVVRQLAEWDAAQKGHYVARVTPYVFVAAEMLGADFEIVGTYESRATGSTTYHSYLVVRREDLVLPGGRPPGPDDVVDLLRRQVKPAEFLFHDRFSTSSYLLPSLFFRRNQVFNMKESTDQLTAINTREIDGGSTNLVKRVDAAGGDGLTFAAVWDGTKAKFEPGGEHAETGRQLHFIQLPTELPNDVLVCSSSLDEAGRKVLHDALTEMGEDPGEPIGSGDFRRWVGIHEASRAQEAMAVLRWLAREAPPKVTVVVEGTTGPAAGGADWIRAAAIDAIRLSGTELVVRDPSFHEQVDLRWSLEAVREGYVVLTSQVEDFKLEPQELPISYRPGEGQREELTQRIGELIHARLHRVRYVWPYEHKQPLIVRDLPFAIEPGTAVKAKAVVWNNHLRHSYSPAAPQTVTIAASDPFKFSIDGGDAARLDRAEAFDPMSNVSYQVVLVRPGEPHASFRLFAASFFLLTVGSLAGAVLAVRRPGGKAAARSK